MPVTDRREPGVYVSIEDASYIAPLTLVGRSVYCVGACSRGPHNRIVELTSLNKWHKLFGKPDLGIVSPSHWCMDNAMYLASKGFYVRVVPDEAQEANFSIESNNNIDTDKILVGTADFIGPVSSSNDGGNEVEVVENNIGDGSGPAVLSNFEVGDWIRPNQNGVTSFYNRKIVEIINDTVNDVYKIILDAPYTGSTVSACNSIIKYNEFTNVETIVDISTINASTNFVGATTPASEGLSTVSFSDAADLAQFNVGDWIRPDGADVQFQRQIIAMEIDTNTNTGVIVLDEKYGGTSVQLAIGETILVYVAYTLSNKTIDAVTKLSQVDMTDDIYLAIVNGVGLYGNKYKLKGTRNVQLEKMYTDNDGNVLYPYMFMNIGLYEETNDGDKLIDGPWVVSLSNKLEDGTTIRDIVTGQNLFIEDVINSNSDLIRFRVNMEKLNEINGVSEKDIIHRREIMLLLSASTPTGTQFYVVDDNSIAFTNGDDGGAYVHNVLDITTVEANATQAYMGSLTSLDGSIEQLREVTYPWYSPDYVISGGWSAPVQNGARFLADYRQDVFHIADTGYRSTYETDLVARLNDYSWNNWTSMLYVQFRTIREIYHNQSISVSPVYQAIKRHLAVDGTYFLAEPVAGIEKGAISEPIKLAYRANHVERGDLIDAELNPTIVEPDGKYFLQQLTTWKRLSILKRAHAAKFVCYVRKMIPPLLKDILERKSTPYWIGQAQSRVSYFLNKFINQPFDAYNVLEWASASVTFDDTAQEINVYIDMKPYGVIERINVYLIVH